MLTVFISIALSIAWISCTNAPGLLKNEPASGESLWAYHCSRCHDIPDPGRYTAAQWEVVGAHMQQRAMLNGEEVKKIVLFLKSTNQ